jgi:FtsP/CotA-like multicopper oxidase with cupredoxin domain
MNLFLFLQNMSTVWWLLNGQQRPVIKTSMTKRNYLQIINQSTLTPLNLVIPKITFDVIAKNGVLLSNIVSTG